jgi:hypothetical protein
VTAQALVGTSCKRCTTFLKKPCDLPGTTDLWERVNEKKVALAAKKAKGLKKEESVAGGLKQKASEDGEAAVSPSRKVVVVEMELQKKKMKKVEVVELEDDEEEELSVGVYHHRVVELLQELVQEVVGMQQSLAAQCFAAEVVGIGSVLPQPRLGQQIPPHRKPLLNHVLREGGGR